jgi:TolA-binding protein
MISEESMEHFIVEADRLGARPPVLNAGNMIASIRHIQLRRRRRNIVLACCGSVAAAILIVGLAWLQHDRSKQFQIAQLQNQIESLNQRLDSTMAMVQKTLSQQRQQEKLDQLEKQLAQYSAADQKLAAQEEETALTILIQADRLQEAKLHHDAAVFYQRVIDMYPNTYWAQIARQKLEDKQNKNLKTPAK